MNDEDQFQHDDDQPRYAKLEDIDPSALGEALKSLPLLGGDLYLRMQALNLALIDQWITGLEYKALQKLIDEERIPLPEQVFLSAQSQMWIFAAYELMRTWRQRVQDMIKWHENGGLPLKLAAFEKEEGYAHFGRQFRAAQIKAVMENPELVLELRRALKRTTILFIRLEAIRISLAKHEVWKKENSVALQPGHGRINSWCGSLDYELESGLYSMGNINRRDIADEIRALMAGDGIPSDEEIASFEKFMRGPANSPF